MDRALSGNGKANGRLHRKKINLALQGGGSHGAFTWGVLDALLEDDRLAIEAISGTSAGAMNAVVLADGWHRGNGQPGARDHLARFWEAIGDRGRFSPVQRTPLDMWFGASGFQNSPGYRWFDMWSRVLSPYDLNPLDINPLRDVVGEIVDFEHVRRCDAIKLFISATNVLNGKVRVFSDGEITLDSVMASACLPTLFKAVEIDGIPYWDGGYAGNPVLFPFFYETDCADVLLVQINPVERTATPRTAADIQDRINEITFNAGLLREFRAIEFVRRLVADGRLDGTRYKAVRMHRIAADPVVMDLPAASKVYAEPAFISELMEAGRAAAKDFLDSHFADIGERATLDLSEEMRADILPVPARERQGKHMQEFMKARSARGKDRG